MSQMFLNVVSTFKGDGLSAATRQLGAFGQAAGGLGSTLGKVGAALASFGIATKAIQFTQKTIDEAKNLQQNLFALDLIFGSLSPQMENFAKNAAKIGLSQAEAAKASVFLGSVMKQSGFEIDDVADKTETLVSLAADLALVYQYDVQEALLGMTALFRGEYDPIEKFGVAMKQSEINAELAARGLDHLTGSQRRLEEQTIRYELFLQRANDSMGAFGRSSGNLAAESLKLSAEFKNMQSTVGAALVPTITDLVIALKPLVEQLTPRLIQLLGDAKPAIEIFNNFLKDLGDETTTTSQVVGHFADSLGTIFRLIAENFGTILTLTALIGGLRVAFLLLTAVMNATPIGFTLTALGLLAGGFILVADAAKKAEINNRELNKQWEGNPWQQAVNPARVYSGILSDVIRKDLDPHSKNIKEIETAWTRAKRAAFDYSTVGRTAATSRPLKGGQAEEFFAAQDLRLFGDTGAAGGAGTGGGSPAAAVLSASDQLNKTLSLGKKQAEAQAKLLGVGLQQGVVNQILSMTKPVKAANDIFKDLTKKNGDLTKKGTKEVAKLNATYDAGIEQVNQARAASAAAASAAAEEARRQAEELRRAEEARIEGLNQLYQNFLDTIKGTFAGIRNAIQGAFDITGLGGSTNAILRNMDKLLTRLKSFSANVKSLATMGLDPALLQQIITAGPMAGARIASALVAGGAGALSAINAGYGQVGSLASEIAETGVRSLFDTQAQQNQYNITVTGGVGSGATIGKAIVDAIKDYERTSGAVWQGA
jgi:hypothetical protein